MWTSRFNMTNPRAPEGAGHLAGSEPTVRQMPQTVQNLRTFPPTPGPSAGSAAVLSAIRHPVAPEAAHHPALAPAPAPAWPEHYALDMRPCFQPAVSFHPGTFAIAGNPNQWILRDDKAYRVVPDTRNATYAIVDWRNPRSAPYPVRYDRASGEWSYYAAAQPGASGVARPRASRESDVQEILGHLSMQDLLLEQRQMLASRSGIQYLENERATARDLTKARRAFGNALRRAAQGGVRERRELGAQRDELRALQRAAADARAVYRGFIRLQPALNLQRQRYEVWRVAHELTGTRPRTDTRTQWPAPPATALDGAATTGGTRDRAAHHAAASGDAQRGAATLPGAGERAA